MKTSFQDQLTGVLAKVNDKLAEIVALKDTVTIQGSIIQSQQRFLEKIDYNERIRNLVTGVPEPTDAADDVGSVKKIFETLGFGDKNFDVKRIGKTGSRPRPLLVGVDSGNIRNNIAEKASDLNKKADFKDIRLKKDQHPAIKREWKRLCDVEAAEKAKSENAGHVIKFDKTLRNITRDDVIIDYWKPHFF